ncbi:MAG: peroxide stress protein YaaA [Betaproteobacteria bacterium]|nr:peroxide stress protein YaaA [Betaproteobacteria bacterium]
MLFLLSPAKTLDFESPLPPVTGSEPVFLGRSSALIDTLRKKTPKQIAALMDLSEGLAQLNVQRYQAWSPTVDRVNARPALLAFNGDVYEGLDAKSLKPKELAWAQGHIAILSGLYGVLRPLDLMQPHRLEMQTALKHGKANNLYQFWGQQIAEHLNEQLVGDQDPLVVNLASQAYFKAVDRKVLQARVIECVFQDRKNGQYKVISFFAKRARGLMARYAVQKKAATIKALQSFDWEGYAFDPSVSGNDTLVFRRHSNG